MTTICEARPTAEPRLPTAHIGEAMTATAVLFYAPAIHAPCMLPAVHQEE